ncbi:methylenetetrahydrofolate reductase [Fibrivirga algicola]|uniref:Methylenetetrahydrofolate reductase n=1 Tax=Fibrivirga algicola TaxID=2950420 RepID=A0ABX0QII9_9BACT|nr:methylenetetrahydrofolate reductase [Fibrivirga algicola]ARK12139.1 methylenetetrahydrofolate reductase [NAD(P)H] [Fibrella sp. ES10-3-2-2]NID11025.1 methylenetetrahydrofolate reductase [NAD(P)H] [Fibrivirga algicola]
MTKITDHIRQANGKPIFSIEVIPPIKGDNLKNLLDNIEPLMEFKPPFIDVTYHREEYIEQPQPDGTIRKIVTRKRPGTVGICSAIMHRFNVDPVPHVLCGGFSRDETEDFLIDLNYLGIDNVLVLRGDPAKPFKTFKAKENGYSYASELVEQVANMNKGQYLHEEDTAMTPSNFCVGVAAYPEKHFEAENHDIDFEYLKQKVARGADYIVTQMFFDNARYFDFVTRCREHDIHIPIIPGLKPISTRKQLEILPRLFHLHMPDDLVNAVAACENDAQARQVGIEWSIQQGRELIAAGAPVLHFYTMGKGDNVQKIARELF